jgi:SAM-dependent methyltransferase
VAPSLTSDLYDAIAPIYDEWQAWRGMMPFARVAAAKLEPLLDREADAARRAGRVGPALIDLGCGTGTLLAEVRRTRPGWRLTGVDASAGMLAVARAKVPTRLADVSDVTFARAHLGAPLPFPAAFDVCTSFYDTLNHLMDTDALARTFAVAATVLRPRGLLVFDVTSRHGFEDWWEASNTFTGAGWRMAIDAGFDRASEIATADVTFERDGRTGHFQIRERYFGRDDIADALSAAGFTVEEEEDWSPFPIGGLGKIWWAARLS